MNRNYKFRGKRTDNDEWVYGSLVQVPKDNTRCLIYQDEWQKGSLGDFYNLIAINVDPSTVGQWTGKKNGDKEDIYEGMIIEDEDGDVYEVEWDIDNGNWHCRNKNDRNWDIDLSEIAESSYIHDKTE